MDQRPQGAGCAYIHAEVRHDSDILTSIPSWLFVVKGAPFYDRRKDTTAGGSGSHRHGDPSTWEYTTNAAVVTDHYMLGYKVEDDDLAFGIGLSKSEVPYDQFALTADLSDEDVDTGVGGGAATMKRYVINGVLTSAAGFEEQLEDFQVQMAARIVDLGGRIGIIGAEERTSVVSLDDGDLVVGEPLQFAPKLQFSDLYGSVSGTFADPANNYQATPYVSQRTAYALLPDGGEAQAVTMDLPLEIHPRRAVRNVSAWLSRESLQPRLIAVFMPKAWKLKVGDWFDFTSERLQLDAEMFEVIDILKNDDFTATLTARAINPDFLAFDNDNDPDLSVPRTWGLRTCCSRRRRSRPRPRRSVAAARSSRPSPLPWRPQQCHARDRHRGAGVGRDRLHRAVAVLYSPLPDQLSSVLRQGLQPATIYRIRLKARAGVRESAWSSWSAPVTTVAQYVVPAASSAAPGSVLESEIARLTDYFPASRSSAVMATSKSRRMSRPRPTSA